MTETPIAAYMRENGIRLKDMAGLLRLSDSYVLLLRDGQKPMTLTVARRLAEVTGKPWHEYLDAALADQEQEAAQ